MISKKLFALLLLFTNINTLYETNSSVKLLDKNNFNNAIKKKFVLIEFFAPWCGHCKNLAPEYEALAKEYGNFFTIAAVDADNKDNREITSKYDIKGFPTLKFISNGKTHDVNARDKNSIISIVKSLIPNPEITKITKENEKEFFKEKKRKIVIFSDKDDFDVRETVLYHIYKKEISFGFISGDNNDFDSYINIDQDQKPVFVYYGDNSDFNDKGEKIKYDGKKINNFIVSLLGEKFDSQESLNILHDQSCYFNHCVKNSNLCVIYVEAGDKSEIKKREKILKDSRDMINASYFTFTKVRHNQNKEFLENMFGKKVKFENPRLFVSNHRKMIFIPYRNKFNENEITEFLTKIVEGNPSEKVRKFKNPDLVYMKEREKFCNEKKRNEKNDKSEL